LVFLLPSRASAEDPRARRPNPAIGEVQVWEVTNKSGGWFHPVHIHLVDFTMLTGNGKPVFSYELGPKDVMCGRLPPPRAAAAGARHGLFAPVPSGS
jgi:Multicopper oxidase